MAIRNLLNSDKSEEFRQSNFGQSNYHNSWWKEIRSAQLHRQPLCEMCLKEGRYVAATLVHRIIPLSVGGTNAPENLISCCVSCFGKIHSARGDSRQNKQCKNGTGSRKNAGEGDNHHDEQEKQNP